MFAAQLESAVLGADLHQLDHLSRDLWKAFNAGVIGEDDAQRIAELIHDCRGAARAFQKPAGAALAPAPRCSIFRPRRLQQSPHRAKSIERRRMLAASGPLPPTLARRFTTGAMAVLRVIADAAKGNGAHCCKSVAEIAARAGVCHRLAQYAIRLAEREGMLTVQERPQRGLPNLVNIVRIVCADWLIWLKQMRGCKNLRLTTKRFSEEIASEGWSRPLRPVLGVSLGFEHPPPKGY